MTETSPIAFKRGPSPDMTLEVFGVDVTFLVENTPVAVSAYWSMCRSRDTSRRRTGMNMKTRCFTLSRANLKFIVATRSYR